VSPTSIVIVCSLLAVVASWLVLDGAGRTRPSLAATIRSVRREPDVVIAPNSDRQSSQLDRLGSVLHDALPRSISTDTVRVLRAIDRRVDRHLGLLGAAALLGLATSTVVVVLLRAAGVIDQQVVFVPAVIGLLAAGIAPTFVHLAALDAAAEVRIDLRHQLSAFVDMVTMLLAGNSGHEGALLQAAEAGDGKLFRELRRRMREVSTTGRSLIDALDLVADDYDVDELRQIAATARLAASEGAPVSRSLAAKCSTLRATLASDQEAQARVRTDKVTPPLVGMTLLFMAVLIYPALNL